MGLGQSVVVGVPLAADGGFDSGLGQSLRVADAHVLRATIGVAHQAAVMPWLSGV